MRSEGVDADAARMQRVMQIAADLGASLEDNDILAVVGERTRDGRSGQP